LTEQSIVIAFTKAELKELIEHLKWNIYNYRERSQKYLDEFAGIEDKQVYTHYKDEVEKKIDGMAELIGRFQEAII
jgi:hypothetical protein